VRNCLERANHEINYSRPRFELDPGDERKLRGGDLILSWELKKHR